MNEISFESYVFPTPADNVYTLNRMEQVTPDGLVSLGSYVGIAITPDYRLCASGACLVLQAKAILPSIPFHFVTTTRLPPADAIDPRLQAWRTLT